MKFVYDGRRRFPLVEGLRRQPNIAQAGMVARVELLVSLWGRGPDERVLDSGRRGPALCAYLDEIEREAALLHGQVDTYG